MTAWIDPEAVYSDLHGLCNFGKTQTTTEHAQYQIFAQNEVWSCSVAVFTFAECKDHANCCKNLLRIPISERGDYAIAADIA